MKTVMVRYKVKAERVDDNLALIAQVFAQIERDRPPGLQYASFRAADGVSFVHLATIATADGSNPLPALSAFKAFTAGIRERCDEPPQATELDAVGLYRCVPA